MILLSCSGPGDLIPVEYCKWIEDRNNDFHAEHQIGNLIFDVQYRPTDYMVCKSGYSAFANIKELDSLRGNYDSSLYISITLKDADGKDPLIYDINGDPESALYYFQYQFQQDIYLVAEDEKEKITPELFHFERFYTVNNCRVFLLAFDKKNIPADKDITLVVDSDYLASGRVQFLYKKELIKNQPRIKI